MVLFLLHLSYPSKGYLLLKDTPKRKATITNLQVNIQKLEENRVLSLEETLCQQGKKKVVCDKKLRRSGIHNGDLVLVYDLRYILFLGKLYTYWIGIYMVTHVWDNGSLSLTYIFSWSLSKTFFWVLMLRTFANAYVTVVIFLVTCYYFNTIRNISYCISIIHKIFKS